MNYNLKPLPVLKNTAIINLVYVHGDSEAKTTDSISFDEFNQDTNIKNAIITLNLIYYINDYISDKGITFSKTKLKDHFLESENPKIVEYFNIVSKISDNYEDRIDNFFSVEDMFSWHLDYIYTDYYARIYSASIVYHDHNGLLYSVEI